MNGRLQDGNKRMTIPQKGVVVARHTVDFWGHMYYLSSHYYRAIRSTLGAGGGGNPPRINLTGCCAPGTPQTPGSADLRPGPSYRQTCQHGPPRKRPDPKIQSASPGKTPPAIRHNGHRDSWTAGGTTSVAFSATFPGCAVPALSRVPLWYDGIWSVAYRGEKVS